MNAPIRGGLPGGIEWGARSLEHWLNNRLLHTLPGFVTGFTDTAGPLASVSQCWPIRVSRS